MGLEVAQHRRTDVISGPAVFRLTEHIERLFNSARIMLMEIPYTVDELVQAVKETVRSTGLPSWTSGNSSRDGRRPVP